MIGDLIGEWIKGILIDGIMGNLSGLFNTVNTKVGEIASDVGSTPQDWNGGIFSMLQNLSETVIVPIAAAILALVMCYELIDMIVEKNNMHDFDSSMFFRWIFKSAFAILIVTNTWNIVMGVFDATQQVVNQSAGVIIGDTSIDFDTLLPDLESRLEAMDIGPLLGLWFQTLVVGLTMNILSETVIVPIAAAILALVMCYELIDMIVEKNNMHDFDSSMFFRWIFKSAFAILIVTNTWNIVMGVFDATQQVVNQSAGVIIGDTSIDFDALLPDLESRLEAMDIGPLLGLWFQTLVVGLTMNILSICIFLVTYGRMIEIYAVTALGPIPLATLGNAEWRGMGQNYLKSLLALGFQAFLIMVVVGIYAVLIQQIGTADDISGAIWGCMGYTVLLCFCLFKTGSISKAVFTAH